MWVHWVCNYCKTIIKTDVELFSCHFKKYMKIIPTVFIIVLYLNTESGMASATTSQYFLIIIIIVC